MLRSVLAVLLTTALAAPVASSPPSASGLPYVDVFLAGDPRWGVPQFRIPALVVTSKGTLLAFAEARYQPASDCGFKVLVVRRSVDSGATWGALANVTIPNTALAVGNPQAVFHGPSGRVVVVFATTVLPAPPSGCSPSDAVWVVDDGGSDGLAWGAPTNLTGQLGNIAGHVVPGPGTGAILTAGAHAGRIIMSGTHGVYGGDLVFFSNDGGATWALASMPGGLLPGMDESVLVERPDGVLSLNMRTAHRNASCDCRAVSTSSDSGSR